VYLRDGSFREDIGCGKVQNCFTGKADALENAKKEAVTDAIKRAWRQFGSLMGNCLYDTKCYLPGVTKMKAIPVGEGYFRRYVKTVVCLLVVFFQRPFDATELYRMKMSKKESVKKLKRALDEYDDGFTPADFEVMNGF
jgi:hypothetical protein